MTLFTGTERYRWLARKSVAYRRPRHVFVESADFSLCTCASRYAEPADWVRNAEREACRVCLRKLEKALEKFPGLQEVTW